MFEAIAIASYNVKLCSSMLLTVKMTMQRPKSYNSFEQKRIDFFKHNLRGIVDHPSALILFSANCILNDAQWRACYSAILASSQ